MNPVVGKTRRARIGLLAPSILSGGAERWMLDLVKYCDPTRIEWTLCYLTHRWYDPAMLTTLADAMPVCREGLRYERGGYSEQAEIEGLRELSARSDAVICWGFTFDFNRLVDGRQAKVVNVSHNFRLDLSRYTKHWHYLAAVSEDCTQGFGPLRDRVKVIENGIDLNRCFPIRSRAAVREQWGCGRGELVILFLGRLAQVKNCHALARAVAGLGEKARLVFYGERLTDEAHIAAEMEQIAGAGRLRFHDPVEDIGSLLHAADVFMLPSFSEGFSLSLLEAWAAGLPVVATRVGGLPRLEQRFGPLATPIEAEDPPETLAAAVRRALGPEGREIAARAREMTLTHYHVSRMAAEWSDFLVDVVEGRALPAKMPPATVAAAPAGASP